MQLLYSIEQKDFKISLVKNGFKNYNITMHTDNGGEFNVRLRSYIDASTLFEQLLKGIYEDINH